MKLTTKCSVLQVLVTAVWVASPAYCTSQEYVPDALTATVVLLVAALPAASVSVSSTSAVPEHVVPANSWKWTSPLPPPVMVAESLGYTD